MTSPATSRSKPCGVLEDSAQRASNGH
jgi:hypothetical protein